MTAIQIDNAYNDLVSAIDRDFRRLKQVLAEQEIKAEEEHLKKIQVNGFIFDQLVDDVKILVFRRNSNDRRGRRWPKKNVRSKRKKNLGSKIFEDSFTLSFSSL